MACPASFLLILLAFIFPPLPVWLEHGLISIESALSIFLTLLGGVPGIIYSVWVIVTDPRCQGAVADGVAMGMEKLS